MAIPKICGTETEYDVAIFYPDGRQVDFFVSGKLLAELVSNFLGNKRTCSYSRLNESPLKSVYRWKKQRKIPFRELKHRRRLRWMPWDTDGFLENGARFYLDCTHPEYSTPECLLPLDLVAHDKAGELAMLEARELFKQQSQEAENKQILVYKTNSDGFGHSFGSHLNVLLPRSLVANRQNFRYLVRQYIPFQIARLVLIGGGKVGAEHQRQECEFQISQRADFFSTRIGVWTTDFRPIFNTRDEPHADRQKYYRLHDISTDSLMCETANFLKIALTQVVLAMIEDKFLEEELFPENPVQAIIKVSRDLKFNQPIRLENGKRLTGLELLRKFLLKAQDYLKDSPMDHQHQLAVQMALELLVQLEKNPFSAFGKLDWVTAWFIQKHSPANEAKARVLLFREISPEGLYYQWLKQGELPRLLDDQTILAAKTQAPVNTRAYLRSALMARYFDQIENMNWVSVWLENGSGFEEIKLDNPLLDKQYYSNLF
jgi:hypothetical protein